MHALLSHFVSSVGFSLIGILGYAQEVKQDSTSQPLHEIIIVNKNPIAEKFSSVSLNRLDIYFNPASSGDPLKAISLLPMSTSSSETANPVLRGALADQSRVYVNGAPVVNPVRNTQENGWGNFSIFNTEMLEKQYVYASNPPLNYGNSTGGMVEIETIKQLNQDSYQVILGLSNLGAQINKKIGESAFVQLYSNFQFSNVLQQVNAQSLTDLNAFQSKDAGLHFRVRLSNRLNLSSYTYYLNERYDAKNYHLQYIGDALAKQKRFFTIQSLEYNSDRSLFKLSTLMDQSRGAYTFANLDATATYVQYFLTVSHRYRIGYAWHVQYGVDYTTTQYKNEDFHGEFFYAMRPQDPVIYQEKRMKFTAVEAYLYTDYKVGNHFGLSLGLRKSMLEQANQFSFLSGQFSTFYKLNTQHRFIFSLGNYNSYITPNSYNYSLGMYNSKQVALDYYWETEKEEVSGAVYFKKDKGNVFLSRLEEFSHRQIWGAEGAYKHLFGRYLSFGVSNTLLYQSVDINNTPNTRWMYFLKSQLTYNNPCLFTASLVGTMHSGESYPFIHSTFFDAENELFIPSFKMDNRQYFNTYFRVDFTINKMVSIRDTFLIVYASITNVLNRSNEKKAYYSTDYSRVYFQNFQGRILYFGLQFKF